MNAIITTNPDAMLIREVLDGHQSTSLAVRIDPYFKENVGRMTQKRIDKIIAAMPDEVHVEKHTSDYGNSYFAVSENDLNEWRKASGLKKK